MKLASARHRSIDGRIVIVALIGLVFLGSGDPARGQGNPDPRITSISPSSAVAGSPGFTLTVSGFNFVGGSVVRWNGQNRTTTFINSTQLNAAIPAGDIAAAGTANVTVFNPPPGGGSSNAVVFTIEPAPRITSINPSSVLAGGPSFLLTVDGENFFAPDVDSSLGGSKIQWDGSQRDTNFVNRTRLTALISASDIATGRTVPITVFTQGIGTSNTATFTINNRVPMITSLNPVSVAAGGLAFNLTVSGTGFLSASVVRWNGSARPTTFVAGAAPALRAAIPASDIATAGIASVTVFNPAPGGGSSNGVSFTVFGNPVPIITSLDPVSAVAGGPAFTLTVDGSGFVLTNGTPGSVVRWNNSDRTTTFVSATRLTAAITAADIATAGTASITVFNPAPGGGTSNAVSFAITPANPVPMITALNPSSATAGSAAFTLTVTGTNFVNGSVVRWNEANRPTTFVASTQLTAAIPAADIAAVGTASITVFNPAPGGGTSNAAAFTIAPANPVPAITALNPSQATAGSPAFTLMVTGTNFVSTSVVRWNDAARPTNFVNTNQLTASISAADIAATGTANVTVFNPAPGGGTSNAVAFTVTAANPVPTITGLNPSMATAGSPAFALDVTGTNFVSGSVVRWNGANRPTTFVSVTQLTAAIPAGDLATTGTAAVSVFNPTPGGGTSNAVTFTISPANAAPVITGLNPSSITARAPAFTLTVTGTNFVSGSVVRWNGANRPTTFVSTTQLTAAVPAGDVVAPATVSITVFNPPPGGGVSNAQNFSVLEPPQVTIGGVGDSVQSREQPSVSLTLSASQRTVLNGQLILTFTPDVVTPVADDSAIQFIATMGRVLNFSFPAENTQAVFPDPLGAMFQTGSVAGTVNLTVFLEGIQNASRAVTIRRQAPTISDVRIGSRTASGFEVVIVGLSNTRALNQAEFRFTARGAGNLATTVVPVNLANDANNWYQGEDSRQFGSQFTLTLAFTVQGDINALGSVSVTLSNGEGTSAPRSASF